MSETIPEAFTVRLARIDRDYDRDPECVDTYDEYRVFADEAASELRIAHRRIDILNARIAELTFNVLGSLPILAAARADLDISARRVDAEVAADGSSNDEEIAALRAWAETATDAFYALKRACGLTAD